MEMERYGYPGWKEFDASRKAMLEEFQRAKDHAKSRAVPVAHGPTGEAAIRSWLGQFLPQKYGVTSGFVIPGIISEIPCVLHNYDVIIYDRLNSPILFAHQDQDTAPQGVQRAIPAKYVHAIFEVKASLNRTSAKEAIEKLHTIHAVNEHLPTLFNSAIIFLELARHNVDQHSILQILCPDRLPHGYWGGLVLKYELNADQVGLFTFSPSSEKPSKKKPLLAVDIDTLMRKDESGRLGFPLPRDGGGLNFEIQPGDDGRFHHNIMYTSYLDSGPRRISLTWGRANFATFAIALLSRLSGEAHESSGGRFYQFGKSYDFSRETPIFLSYRPKTEG